MEKEYIPFEVYSKLDLNTRGPDRGFVFNQFGRRTWGLDGAGMLVVSEDLKKILLLKRSEDVEDPFLWGIPGGPKKKIASD